MMKRRQFLGIACAVGAQGLTPALSAQRGAADAGIRGSQVLPDALGNMPLESLRDEYRRRLFDEYLPFWDRGGYDEQHGGFRCELNDDGSVAIDKKTIWYQGRGLWVYSFLHNHFGKKARWLEMASKTRDFMVERMYAGDGKWIEEVRSDGTVLSPVAPYVYGWLFAAGGLAQHYAAAGDPRDLKLAKETIDAAATAYDDPTYADTYGVQYAAVPIPEKGFRTQGHSMALVWALSQMLKVDDDPHLVELQRRHVDLVMNRFWNPDYGVANEFLSHDYSRIAGAESHMYAGHSLEALWIVMHEAIRIKDRTLFDRASARVRRVLEMCWDYVFDGWAGADFFVSGSPKHGQGPNYDLKTMWSQCEILIACLTVLEYTGQGWATEWYDRARAFALGVTGLPLYAARDQVACFSHFC